MIKKDLVNSIKYFAFALVIALGVGYVAAAWTGPTATPPGNNTDVPINVSAADQVKDGGLSIKGPFKLPSVITAGHQSQLCTDGTTGAVVKCAPDNTVPFLYKTAEMGNSTAYWGPNGRYTFIDNNLSFAINGITVYNEYWDTSGLFTLAHDGDVITVHDFSVPGTSYPNWTQNRSSILLRVVKDGQNLFCNVNYSMAGDSFSFTVEKGHQYVVLTDSSDAEWRYLDTSTGSNQWTYPC